MKMRMIRRARISVVAFAVNARRRWRTMIGARFKADRAAIQAALSLEFPGAKIAFQTFDFDSCLGVGMSFNGDRVGAIVEGLHKGIWRYAASPERVRSEFVSMVEKQKRLTTAKS